MWFIIIFVILPLAEIAAFIQVGGFIGTPKTLLLCLLTAIIGGFLVKIQGMDTLFKARQSLSMGELPYNAIFDGICLAIAGALMITPGFVTDAIAFSLLLPPVRVFVRTYILKSNRFQIYNMDEAKRRTQGQAHQAADDVIDGEFVEVPPEQLNEDNNPNKG